MDLMDKCYYIYIMTNIANKILYIGVTNDLIRRVYEHRNGLIDGFTKKYKLHKLVYFEQYSDIKLALQREKNLKHWIKDWKIQLIEKFNPEWDDLYPHMADPRVKPEDDKIRS